MPETIAIAPDDYRRVLGHYPTGVCVVAALDAEGGPVGMVVGSFTSVSMNPPLVGFFPDRGSTSWPRIEAAGHFCVNVMGADQLDVCRSVGARGADKFVGVEFVVSDHGLPLIVGALAAIECELHSVTDAGDHWFVLGRVLRLEALRDHDPLLFHKGRYGGFLETA